MENNYHSEAMLHLFGPAWNMAEMLHAKGLKAASRYIHIWHEVDPAHQESTVHFSAVDTAEGRYYQDSGYEESLVTHHTEQADAILRELCGTVEKFAEENNLDVDDCAYIETNYEWERCCYE